MSKTLEAYREGYREAKDKLNKECLEFKKANTSLHRQILNCKRQIKENLQTLKSGIEMTVTEYYDKPCVYFLMRENKIIYIGQTKCALTRIGQHKHNLIEFDSFMIHKFIEDEKKRLNLEKRLIKKHRPILNSVHNRDLKPLKGNRR